MKTQDLFTDDDEFEFNNVDFESYQELLYNPVHVDINPDTIVDVIHNGQVIKTDEWEKVIDWINTDWDSLNGQYDVSQQGAVLHTIKVSH